MKFRICSRTLTLGMGVALLPVYTLADGSVAQTTALSDERVPRSHQVSPHISSAVMAGLPKYGERTMEDAAIEPGSPAIDDDVVRLPKSFVFAFRPPAFSEREYYSKSEFAALLRKRYPGASLRGQDPDRVDGSVPNYAALMYAQDQRLIQMKGLTELSATLRRDGDPSGSNALRAEIQKAFIRPKDALTEAMDKSANNGRR